MRSVHSSTVKKIKAEATASVAASRKTVRNVLILLVLQGPYPSRAKAEGPLPPQSPPRGRTTKPTVSARRAAPQRAHPRTPKTALRTGRAAEASSLLVIALHGQPGGFGYGHGSSVGHGSGPPTELSCTVGDPGRGCSRVAVHAKGASWRKSAVMSNGRGGVVKLRLAPVDEN